MKFSYILCNGPVLVRVSEITKELQEHIILGQFTASDFRMEANIVDTSGENE